MEYADELAFAKNLALEAGKIMRTNFIAGTTREWKSDGTPITVTDTTINAMVVDKIAEKYPDHSVLGEEQSHNLGQKMVWVCDPVDGTMPFSHGVPISTFSLALVEDGTPVVGVVYDPYMDRLFSAVKGQGAYLNDTAIHVTDNGMQNALIEIAAFPSATPVVKAGGSFGDVLRDKGSKVTAMWSVILPTSLVAAGQYTAAVFNHTKPEDGAAIKVIVEEAGGKVTDLFGNEQRYDQPTKGFIASNGVVHQEIVDILATFERV